MSTRSIVAYVGAVKGKKSWQGVYCHWDGYPTNRGKKIWDILHKEFLDVKKLSIGGGDNLTATKRVKAFIEIYIKGHMGGYSSFPDKCYCHDAEFVMRDGVPKSKPETPGELKNTWCEWAYILDADKLTLTILSTYKNKWKTPVAVINLLGKKPNWGKIQNSI